MLSQMRKMTLMPGKLVLPDKLMIPEKQVQKQDDWKQSLKPPQVKQNPKKMISSQRLSSSIEKMGDFINKYRDSKILVLPEDKEFHWYENMIPQMLNESRMGSRAGSQMGMTSGL